MKSWEPETLDRVIQMAWEDRTPFEAIFAQFGLNESEVIELMRRELYPAGFRRWRKRVNGRTTKHLRLRSAEFNRFHCPEQRIITRNRISKKRY